MSCRYQTSIGHQEQAAETRRSLPPQVDTLSITDVVHKVNVLNEEIFQAVALLGRCSRVRNARIGRRNK